MRRSIERPLDDLPPTLWALWRTLRIGFRAEPRLLVVAFAMNVVSSLPDPLIALWLAGLVDGVEAGDRTKVWWTAGALAGSATLVWFLGVVFERTERRRGGNNARRSNEATSTQPNHSGDSSSSSSRASTTASGR